MDKTYKIKVKNNKYFNPKDILECGQIFRYDTLPDGSYQVFSLDKYAKIQGVDGDWTISTQDEAYFKHFFDLSTDYGAIVDTLSKINPVLKQATEYGKGIRILNQDITETIISFIISANNNIKRIQLILNRLCTALGKKTDYGYAFPSLKDLAGQDSSFFTQIGAGYRAPYLNQTAKILYNDFDFDALKTADTLQARKMLLSLMGVGNKVADCILLFGLRRQDVFPVDTWIKKVYHKYFETGLSDNKIADYFVSIFKDMSGFAQQYLFYFLRTIDK